MNSAGREAIAQIAGEEAHRSVRAGNFEPQVALIQLQASSRHARQLRLGAAALHNAGKIGLAQRWRGAGAGAGWAGGGGWQQLGVCAG